jgi:hypothetical protein
MDYMKNNDFRWAQLLSLEDHIKRTMWCQHWAKFWGDTVLKSMQAPKRIRWWWWHHPLGTLTFLPMFINIWDNHSFHLVFYKDCELEIFMGLLQLVVLQPRLAPTLSSWQYSMLWWEAYHKASVRFKDGSNMALTSDFIDRVNWGNNKHIQQSKEHGLHWVLRFCVFVHLRGVIASDKKSSIS